MTVTDEDHKPIAVQIDHDDWMEIETQLNLQKPESRCVDLSRFAEKLTMELPKDPVGYQHRIRDEWT